MKITDINCMIGSWPDKRLRFRDADSLLEAMNSYRIESCVAYHSHALVNTWEGNDAIRDIAVKSDGRIRACYVLSPNLGSSQMPDGETLFNQLKTEKPSAVRLVPNTSYSQTYLIDSFYCGELLDILNELRLPVLFDRTVMPGAAYTQGPSYESLPVLANTYPGIKFVLLRHPMNESRFTMPLLSKTSNVYFDASIMVDQGIIEEIVLKHGSDRLLFGSGMPFFMPAGALGHIFYSRISDCNKEAILAKNWQRIEEESR